MERSRRDVFKLGLLGSAVLVLPAERVARSALQLANRLDPARLPALGQEYFRVPPVAVPTATRLTVPGKWISPGRGPGFEDVDIDYYEIRMRQVFLPILPGVPDTQFWAYGGVTPGPTIHAERGRPVLVRQRNELFDQHPVLRYGPPQTSVHLHGNASLPQHDGYASDTTSPGQFKDYWYPTIQDARTLWYHDHGVHHTASNAYMGLAAQYHLHDDSERSSGLPLHDQVDQYGQPFDCPLTLRDALFDSDGQLIFDDQFESSAYGDVNLVNGVPWPNMKVEPRKYRFRILDAAVSRSYELALVVRGSSTRRPMTVVGTDGGLMATAQSTTALRIGMAERYEVVIDFAPFKGQTLLLNNLLPKNNVNFPTSGRVMQFQVGTTVSDTRNNATVPGTALRSQAAECMTLVADGATPRRTLEFKRENGHWTINGKTWVDVERSRFQAALATPAENSVEQWTLTNPHGGWFHPVHIHLIDFQVQARRGGRNAVQAFERGPKDVVYIGENETVDVIARFGPQCGRYMMHCHNLVHEDHDMMHQFWVKPDAGSASLDEDPMGSRATRVLAAGALRLPPVPGRGPQFPPAVTT